MNLKELIALVIIVALLVLSGIQLVKHNTYTYNLSNRMDQLELDLAKVDLELSSHVAKLYKQDKDMLELLKGYQEQMITYKKTWGVKY